MKRGNKAYADWQFCHCETKQQSAAWIFPGHTLPCNIQEIMASASVQSVAWTSVQSISAYLCATVCRKSSWTDATAARRDVFVNFMKKKRKPILHSNDASARHCCSNNEFPYHQSDTDVCRPPYSPGLSSVPLVPFPRVKTQLRETRIGAPKLLSENSRDIDTIGKSVLPPPFSVNHLI